MGLLEQLLPNITSICRMRSAHTGRQGCPPSPQTTRRRRKNSLRGGSSGKTPGPSCQHAQPPHQLKTVPTDPSAPSIPACAPDGPSGGLHSPGCTLTCTALSTCLTGPHLPKPLSWLLNPSTASSGNPAKSSKSSASSLNSCSLPSCLNRY